METIVGGSWGNYCNTQAEDGYGAVVLIAVSYQVRNSNVFIHPSVFITGVCAGSGSELNQKSFTPQPHSLVGEFRGISEPDWLCWNASIGRCLEGVLINA